MLVDCAQLTEMPKRFLQNQAARMGLDSEGLKAQLVERLETHLVDQMGPEGLLTLGPGSLPPPPDPVGPALPGALLINLLSLVNCQMGPEGLVSPGPGSAPPPHSPAR